MTSDAQPVRHEAHRARILALPLWSGDVAVEPLAGGMTNLNYRVRDGRGAYVVRFGEDIPVHGVMRFNELAAARAAHAAGLSPEILHASPGLMVSRCLSARAFEPADVRSRPQLARILEMVRRCHFEVPRHHSGPVLAFWVFQVVRSYVASLRSASSRLSPLLTALEADAARLERLVGPVTLVFGHNDLLAANILDDGARLWLIDWDYAGLNSPLFDLANLASNNGLSPDDEEWVLTTYFGAPPAADTRRAFAAMKCASLLREALWSAVSEIHSRIDFDYVSYTDDYLARFQAAMASQRG